MERNDTPLRRRLSAANHSRPSPIDVAKVNAALIRIARLIGRQIAHETVEAKPRRTTTRLGKWVGTHMVAGLKAANAIPRRIEGTMMDHPLDRPIWTALTTNQAGLALVAGNIRRYDPAFAPFAATSDGSPDSFAGLADLVSPGGNIILQQAELIAAPPGLSLIRSAATVQMIAAEINGAVAEFAYEVLRDDDAPEMRELAALTKPGPFAARTHQLGEFIGVRADGRLVAMAGERMRAGSFTEISGVCTHPDHRGHGYAAGLMRAIALYERLASLHGGSHSSWCSSAARCKAPHPARRAIGSDVLSFCTAIDAPDLSMDLAIPPP